MSLEILRRFPIGLDSRANQNHNRKLLTHGYPSQLEAKSQDGLRTGPRLNAVSLLHAVAKYGHANAQGQFGLCLLEREFGAIQFRMAVSLKVIYDTEKTFILFKIDHLTMLLNSVINLFCVSRGFSSLLCFAG
jgi:hypothetical protein